MTGPVRVVEGNAITIARSDGGNTVERSQTKVRAYSPKRSNHMVSPKVRNEIRERYEALAGQSLDIHKYSDRMFDVVFEIITADTYVAGVASKIIDGDTVTPDDWNFIGRPMLMEGRWWRCDDGQLFDIEQDPEIKLVASSIESLRHKCNDAKP